MRYDFASLINFRRFRDDRKGAVGVMFALTAVPSLLAVGAAVDLTRATQFKTTLQEAVDAAAIAGAGSYTDAATATSVATKYMNASLSYFPSYVAVNFTVTPATLTAGNQTIGYTVKVAAVGTVKTTLMSIAIPLLTIGANATAEDPVVTAAADFTGFSSSACDQNSIYMYNVPTDGSLPPSSSWSQIYSNAPVPDPKNNPCIGNTTGNGGSFTVRSGQRLGFVLVNVTGGLQAYPNNGTNQYGGANGSTHTFYSQLSPPSQVAYPLVTQNCTIQTAVLVTGSPLPAAPKGCISTLPQYATPTCAQIGSQQIRYFWNDMGGITDDADFNDAEYTFTCAGAGAGSGPSRVALIK